MSRLCFLLMNIPPLEFLTQSYIIVEKSKVEYHI